jgi:V8-like Glu-specific endopeptidase
MRRLGKLTLAIAGALALACGLLVLVGESHSRAATKPSHLCSPEQQGASPYHREPYPLDSGVHDGTAAQATRVFVHTIRVPGAAWLRVHWSDYNLGTLSAITVTSLKDGSQQRLDGTSIQRWRGSSAFFNGDAVEVALYAAPGDRGVFFRIAEISVGEPAAVAPAVVLSPEELCGEDNRQPATDRAIGRFIFDEGPSQIGRCTGWIASNGAILTAGHCADFGAYGAPDMIEFNVPTSTVSGDVVFSDADDQYPIGQRVGFRNNGLGDDWGVFSVLPNSNTDLLPAYAQGAFYRVALPGDVSPSTVRVTGYGIDDTPAERNRILQTDSGAYRGAASTWVSYTVDAESGNSGSPVIDTATRVSVGIHTHGGCAGPDGANYGTSFEHDDLASTLHSFPGGIVSYVDNDHPAPTGDGNVLRPWWTVDLGVYFAASGQTISIVKGSYDEAITITKALTLTAPVGTVTIGM